MRARFCALFCIAALATPPAHADEAPPSEKKEEKKAKAGKGAKAVEKKVESDSKDSSSATKAAAPGAPATAAPAPAKLFCRTKKGLVIPGAATAAECKAHGECLTFGP